MIDILDYYLVIRAIRKDLLKIPFCMDDNLS